jgi:hypothetical protein
MTRVLAFLISLRRAGRDLPFHKQRGAEVFLRPFPSWGVPTRGRAASDYRPVAIGEQPVVIIACDENEPYLAGDEGIQRLVDARSLGTATV